jgi:hypothetical protein
MSRFAGLMLTGVYLPGARLTAMPLPPKITRRIN